MRLLLATILASLATAATAVPFAEAAQDKVRLIYEFPKYTWLENLAVRPNGNILCTTITPHPDLYMVDPTAASPKPTLVHRFPHVLSLLGITETTPDNFYVIASNGSLETLTATNNRIYNVKFPATGSGAPAIKFVSYLPEAELLNGLTTLNDTTLLAADSRKGVVWAIDTETGAKRIVLDDPLMASSPNEPFLGVNGIHIRGSTLYFTNTQLRTLAKMQIHPDGTAASAATHVATTPGKNHDYDDFALGPDGDEFLATGGGNSISRVNRHGKQRIIAGHYHSTEIAEPSSAAFGRTSSEAGILYVTTGGGLGIPVNDKETIGAQLLAVDVRESFVQ